MKNDHLKNIVLFAIIGVSALLLRRCGTPDKPAVDIPPAIVYRFDTVFVHVRDDVPAKVYVRERTVHDTVLIVKPQPVIDTPVMVLFVDADMPDSMRIYEGVVQGTHCALHYQAGVARDSLQYLYIENECQAKDSLIIVEPGKPRARFTWTGRPEHLLGLKVGRGPNEVSTAGLQYSFGGFYVSANYLVEPRLPFFELGFMLNLSRRRAEP